jgi:hypothetical protein
MKMPFAAFALMTTAAWAEEKIEVLRARPIHMPTEYRFMLIGQTATDAVSPSFFGDEMRVFNLRAEQPRGMVARPSRARVRSFGDHGRGPT